MSVASVPRDLPETIDLLRGMSAEDRICWAVDQFGEGAVLLSSMQETSSVIMSMFHRLGLENEILFVDTGFHFHETLRFRDGVMRRYKLNVVTLYPTMTPLEQEQEFGRKLHLFVDGQKECCRLRKEEPFVEHMRRNGRKVVMNGLRTEEGGSRKKVHLLSPDPRFAGFALHPLFDWTAEQIATYLSAHNVPIHPLHARSYPSIGCACCTTPVQPGEDPRAGRWRHLREQKDEQAPQYCGINFSDGSGI